MKGNAKELDHCMGGHFFGSFTMASLFPMIPEEYLVVGIGIPPPPLKVCFLLCVLGGGKSAAM